MFMHESKGVSTDEKRGSVGSSVRPVVGSSPAGSSSFSSGISSPPVSTHAQELKAELEGEGYTVDMHASRGNELVVAFYDVDNNRIGSHKIIATADAYTFGDPSEYSNGVEFLTNMQSFFSELYQPRPDRDIVELPDIYNTQVSKADKKAVFNQLKKIRYYYQLSYEAALLKLSNDKGSLEYETTHGAARGCSVVEQLRGGHKVLVGDLRRVAIEHEIRFKVAVPSGIIYVEGDQTGSKDPRVLRSAFSKQVQKIIAREQAFREQLVPALARFKRVPDGQDAEAFLLKSKFELCVYNWTHNELAFYFKTGEDPYKARIFFSATGQGKLEGLSWTSSHDELLLQIDNMPSLITLRTGVINDLTPLLALHTADNWSIRQENGKHMVYLRDRFVPIEFVLDRTSRPPQWGACISGSSKVIYGDATSISRQLFNQLEDLYYTQVNPTLPPQKASVPEPAFKTHWSPKGVESVESQLTYLSVKNPEFKSRVGFLVGALLAARGNTAEAGTFTFNGHSDTPPIHVSWRADQSFLVSFPGEPPKTLRTLDIRRILEQIGEFYNGLAAAKQQKAIAVYVEQLAKPLPASPTLTPPAISIQPTDQANMFIATFASGGSTPVSIKIFVAHNGYTVETASFETPNALCTTVTDVLTHINQAMRGVALASMNEAQQGAITRLDKVGLFEKNYSLGDAHQLARTPTFAEGITICYPPRHEQKPDATGKVELAVLFSLDAGSGQTLVKRSSTLDSISTKDEKSTAPQKLYVRTDGQFEYAGEVLDVNALKKKLITQCDEYGLDAQRHRQRETFFTELSRAKPNVIVVNSTEAFSKVDAKAIPYAVWKSPRLPGNSLGVYVPGLSQGNIRRLTFDEKGTCTLPCQILSDNLTMPAPLEPARDLLIGGGVTGVPTFLNQMDVVASHTHLVEAQRAEKQAAAKESAKTQAALAARRQQITAALDFAKVDEGKAEKHYQDAVQEHKALQARLDSIPAEVGALQMERTTLNAQKAPLESKADDGDEAVAQEVQAITVKLSKIGPAIAKLNKEQKTDIPARAESLRSKIEGARTNWEEAKARTAIVSADVTRQLAELETKASPSSSSLSSAPLPPGTASTLVRVSSLMSGPTSSASSIPTKTKEEPVLAGGGCPTPGLPEPA